MPLPLLDRRIKCTFFFYATKPLSLKWYFQSNVLFLKKYNFLTDIT